MSIIRIYYKFTYNKWYIWLILPNNPVYDIDHFKTALDSTSSKKYLIIDRVSFPLGLETGRKLLDSLHLNKQLLIKEGDFEFYSVNKQ